MKHLLFQNDWLASWPVFYNEKTGKASHNINDVIDFADQEFHPEGFNNYLDFGYSVLEQTPVKNVKFLRHSARLWCDEQGRLSVEYLDDPVERWLDYHLSERDVINLIQDRVRKWERSVEGEIIIPTSGGYDSRLLNWCIEDKSRIRSFTYGTSENQVESYEVVYAQRLSEILGTCWEQIPLGDFHLYLDCWDKLFGASTHAHGMYHFEFYHKILSKVNGGNPFLSGIIGDAWAGSADIPVLESLYDVNKLGYTHGLQADSAQSLFHCGRSIISSYWDIQKNRLENSRFRIVEAMRFKIILLCYLRIVPDSFAFKWWSPFLDIDVAMAMLNLPPERRRNRIWQKEFFQKVGLDLENMHLQETHKNSLDLQALRRIPLRSLDVKLLREVVKPDYVEWINRNTRNARSGWNTVLLKELLGFPKIAGVLCRLGFSDTESIRLKAYIAYMIMLPIENLLKRRTLGEKR